MEMPQTVIALFTQAAEARDAQSQLLSSGFANDMVDVSSNSASPGPDERREGAIKRFFRELFGQDDEAGRYAAAAERNDAVVTVHALTPDDAMRASQILDDAGAIDIDERASFATEPPEEPAEEETLEVLEEDLVVGKRVVETGGARVRSRIVERPVEEDVRLRAEHVVVDRRPVDRPASPADLDAFQSGEIDVVERAEVPVITKEARVVEEISVGVEVDERNETIRETVRGTEVDVDELPPGGQVGERSRQG
jgi:uncharacterized protein (TIGR02271 family)